MNADGMLGINNNLISYNLFVYCSNNPVMLCDSTGHKDQDSIRMIYMHAYKQGDFKRRDPSTFNATEFRKVIGSMIDEGNINNIVESYLEYYIKIGGKPPKVNSVGIKVSIGSISISYSAVTEEDEIADHQITVSASVSTSTGSVVGVDIFASQTTVDDASDLHGYSVSTNVATGPQFTYGEIHAGTEYTTDLYNTMAIHTNYIGGSFGFGTLGWNVDGGGSIGYTFSILEIWD